MRQEFALLRGKPRSFRLWMNAERVPFEAPKERSRVCFGEFRPLKHVEGPRALARGAPQLLICFADGGMVLGEQDSSAMNSKKPFDFAWVIVGVSFMTLGLTYGVMYCFSVFFVALLKEFGWSRSVASGAFSVSTILQHLIGPVVGRAVDRFGPRRVVLLGSLMLFLGLFLSSLIQTPWQYYVSFGFLTATGIAGTGWVTNTTVIHYWFKEKRGLPTGIISSGIGIGILLCVPTTQYLIDQIGWRMTYRILAWVVPGVIALMAVFLLGKSPPFGLSRPLEKDRGLPELRESEALDQEWEPQHWTVRRAMITKQFWFLFWAFFLGSFTSQTVFTHQVVFFVDRGMDALSASYIVGLVGIASVGAKILLGTLSDRIGREAAYTIGISFGGFGVLVLIAFNYISLPVLPYFYAFLFAMGYAVTAALPPVITGDFFGGSTYGRIFGTLTIANGLGGAFGAWLAGLIYDQVRSYLPAFLLVIVCFLLASYCIWKAAPRKMKTARGKRLEFISTE